MHRHVQQQAVSAAEPGSRIKPQRERIETLEAAVEMLRVLR